MKYLNEQIREAHVERERKSFDLSILFLCFIYLGNIRILGVRSVNIL